MPEDPIVIKPGGVNMQWDKVPDGIHCTWCGCKVLRIGAVGPDLCKQCAKIRGARKKAEDGLCRGGCGKRLLWHYLRCGDCTRLNRWSLKSAQASLRSSKKPRGKGLKTAELYYDHIGEHVPWMEDINGGTWG